MNKIKYILAFSGLIFGFFIFSTSLIMASQGVIDDSTRVSEKKFYISRTILPDNILYPSLMVADRIILTISPGEHKVYTKIHFAEDRFRTARLLLAQGDEKLAFTALTKSQKYLITAAHSVLSNNDSSEQVVEAVIKALKVNSNQLIECKKDFKYQDTTPINDLIHESEILTDQLQSFKQ